MVRLIMGIPSKWLLALLATLLGGAAVAGTGTVVIVLAANQGEVLPPVLEPPVVEAIPLVPFVSPVETITPTVTPTTTVPLTPTVTPTTTMPLTSTLPLTLTVVPTKPGMSGLAFHPAHLNAGGKCGKVYSAQGSLKNHGPALATGVEIAYEVVSGAEWVDRVEVTPAQWAEMGTSKPGRFTVHVYTNEDWPSAGKGAQIEVRLYIAGEAGAASALGEEATEAIFRVKNQCKEDKPDKPEKPVKPEKPEKSVKPEKTKEPARPEKPPKPDKPDKPKKKN